jgi:hypothetical protein
MAAKMTRAVARPEASARRSKITAFRDWTTRKCSSPARPESVAV